MTNAIQKSNPTDAFRAVASDRLISAATMTPHQLLDEYMRLSVIIEENRIEATDPEEYGVKYTDAGNLAIKELGIINGTAKARFGFYFLRSEDF